MRPMTMAILAWLLLTTAPAVIVAQGTVGAEGADSWIASHDAELKSLNQSIWSHPELGLQEHHAASELIRFLEQAGFEVERGVAGMPTAFVATAGSGEPVIGILAEYDALPGMSQATVPRREPRTDAPSGSEADIGHACGHSVYGTASAGAAAAAWHAARQAGLPGTIRLYGTPAEETGIGKVFMQRAGLFDDLDAALEWHSSDRTQASFDSSKAMVNVKFRFAGLAAHASRSPHQGRSALDAVELMSVGVNFLREHLRDDARIHYVITDGGGQPNVVPPRAEVWYYVRADDHAYVEYVFERVREIARGAALMTRTDLEERIDTDVFEILPNRPLAEVLHRQLTRVGPPDFDAAEREFARLTQATLADPPSEPLATSIEPLADEPTVGPASSDVGNVSWAVPTGGINVATQTLGAPGHSWQIVACTGMSIGEKGMIVAARTLAGATLELLASPETLERARSDFETRRANGKIPQSVLPEGQTAPH
ncbi:MAG: amidohydrolase [Thermoanaerobaculia bacterium]